MFSEFRFISSKKLFGQNIPNSHSLLYNYICLHVKSLSRKIDKTSGVDCKKDSLPTYKHFEIKVQLFFFP